METQTQRSSCRGARRQANRIHCKETRERRKERERLLRELLHEVRGVLSTNRQERFQRLPTRHLRRRVMHEKIVGAKKLAVPSIPNAMVKEVESLLLYQLMVEDGPDLFSMHAFELHAPFSFISKTFCHKLQMVSTDVIGKPLSSIVDPRDVDALHAALSLVLNQEDTGEDPLGMTVHVRLAHGTLASCEASMSISIGSEGLVVVTRVY